MGMRCINGVSVITTMAVSFDLTIKVTCRYNATIIRTPCISR
nr:MAG TPA: hypothetical protein [Caudoviricetes sp.]